MAVFMASCLFLIIPVHSASFEWTHHMVLDRDNMFHILWTPDKDKITFEMQVISIHTVNPLLEDDLLLFQIQNSLDLH